VFTALTCFERRKERGQARSLNYIGVSKITGRGKVQGDKSKNESLHHGWTARLQAGKDVKAGGGDKAVGESSQTTGSDSQNKKRRGRKERRKGGGGPLETYTPYSRKTKRT